MMKNGVPYRFAYLFAVVALLLLAGGTARAQVNEPELQNLDPVEFISYEGPHSRIETRAQIRAIGYNLGAAVKAGAVRPGEARRYFIIHSVSEADGPKLDADIFGLGPDVGVDHIRNLRLIIQGYLEGAYDYSERDAALLANYITVYNAVYRGDIGYFDSRYKSAVMENITQEKAGLAIRYDEWPGQTLILIPLGSGLGGPLSAIDTGTLSDPRVIDQLREEPDMGLAQRRDMVELMEREADQAEQEAAVIREAIREEERALAEERREAQDQQREAQDQQRQAQEEQRQAQEEQRRITEERQQPGADQQALDRQAEEAARREEEAARQEEEARQQAEEAREQLEELEEREEALDELREEAEAQEAFAEERAEQAQEERQQIAEDQQALIDRLPAEAQAGGMLGVSIVSQDYLGRLVKIDPASGGETLRSPLNTVNVRTVTVIGGRIFAVAGEDRGSGAIRLVEINSDTLEMQKQGDDDIAPGSLLWVSGQDLYAIARSGGSLNVAKFNADLVLQARSAVAVHANAAVLVRGDVIATQRPDGSAVLLNTGDLAERK